METNGEVKEYVNMANKLLAIHDSEIMKNDEEFWPHLKAITEKHPDEEDIKKVKEFVSNFIEFYRKYTHLNTITPNKEIGSHPVRMYVDGCFDMVHSGHFNAIRQAKALCDILVVGVVCDEEVIHHKG